MFPGYRKQDYKDSQENCETDSDPDPFDSKIYISIVGEELCEGKAHRYSNYIEDKSHVYTRSDSLMSTGTNSYKVPNLLAYQSEPVRHLLDRCHSQKGVLVWHAMGTGKSATGLSFLGTLSKLKVILLLPENLLDVWMREGIKFGVDLKRLISQKRVTVLCYEKPQALIAALRRTDATKYALIADEAHHLVGLLKDKKTKASEGYEMIKKMQGFQKILLLTGTPMYNDETDFRMLVNIAAGKIVLPLHVEEFQQQYYQTSVWRSIVIGWMLSFFDKFLYPTRDFVNAGLNLDMILRGTDSASRKFFDAIISVVQKVLVNFEISALVAVSLPLIVPLILLMIIRIALRSQTSKIRLLNGEKLAKAVKSYVSYYEIPVSARGNDYPKVTIVQKTCNYNAHQIDLWLRFAMGKATSQELVRLGVSKSAAEADYFGDVMEMDVYKYHGRVIGNLCFKEEECSKFIEIEKLMRKADGTVWQTVIYSNFERQGGMLFAEYLKRVNIDFIYFSPTMTSLKKRSSLEQFASGKTSVLILHPSYVEGLSISNARQMHILEPVENQAVLEQIMARVARYGSHMSLEIAERNVRIYTWSAIATSFYAKLIKFGKAQKLWSNNQKYVGPWASMSRFGVDITPDALITTRSELFGNNLKRLTRYLEKHNLLSLEINKRPKKCRLITDMHPETTQNIPACNDFG